MHRLAARSAGVREFRQVSYPIAGGGDFVVMAGPCSVESEDQLFRTAAAVSRCGATVLRGGAFKPRTSPYDFQGMGEDGLKLLAAAGRRYGLAVVTEVMADHQVDIVAKYADILQIGSRSMENYVLLQAAAQAKMPVLLKRGMTATIEEFVESAEILVAHGCPQVMLCERGIRTYGSATRNTCDIAAVPLLQQMTGMPVILDPSHATGRRDLIEPVSRAGVAIGADGIIVEVHPKPEEALSDGPQSLTFADFEALMASLQPYLELWREARGVSQPAMAVAAGR